MACFLILRLDLPTMSTTARVTTSISRGAPPRAAHQIGRMAMMQGWKQRLFGTIALAAAIALGSTMAETTARADHEWSWEGAIVGGIIGGLIGPTSGKRYPHRESFSVGVTLGAPYDGPFIVHRHHGGWHRHSRHHRHGWSLWLEHPGPRHIHPRRYQHRQWHGPQVQVRPWHVRPERHQYRQWHGPQVHRQPRHVHPHQHQHRHRHKQWVHQQPRPVHPERHRHGHDHRW